MTFGEKHDISLKRIVSADSYDSKVKVVQLFNAIKLFFSFSKTFSFTKLECFTLIFIFYLQVMCLESTCS